MMPFFVLRMGTFRLERLSELDSELSSVNSNTVPEPIRIVILHCIRGGYYRGRREHSIRGLPKPPATNSRAFPGEVVNREATKG